MRRRVSVLVVVLVAVTTVLVEAPPAQADPFSDDFNRADGTSLGDNWSEVIGTDLAISGNALTNPASSAPFALALFATGNRVTAKVGSTSLAGAYVALVLAHKTLGDSVFVKAYDSNGNAILDRISVSRGINDTSVVDVPVTPFGGGIMQVTLVGSRLKVTVGDLGSPTPFISERFTLADVPDGTGVGVGATKNATIDDFASSVFVPSSPTISSSVESTDTPSASGWYAAPVTVGFTCTADSSPIVACTDDAVLGEGADQQVTGTALADDGGTATTIETIDVDLTPPTVAIAGLTAKPYFEPPELVATCVGVDAVSGIDTCTLGAAELPKDQTEVVAIATNEAGLTKQTSTIVLTPDFGVLGVPFVKKRYEVKRGAKVTLVVLGSKKIFLVGVGDVTRTPKAFKAKNGRMELRLKVPADTPLGKTTLTLRRGSGTTFTLPIAVRR